MGAIRRSQSLMLTATPLTELQIKDVPKKNPKGKSSA